MVGGKVIGIARTDEDTLLHVQGTGGESHDTCSVRCKEESLHGNSPIVISVGDSVWWQGRLLMWTPEHSLRLRPGKDCDVKLPRVGYSH
jgi:hypothetical protein